MKCLFCSVIFTVTAVVVASAERSNGAPHTERPMPDDSQRFCFAVVPDRAGGDYRHAWTNALEKLNLLRPDFAMTVGDVIPASWLDEKTVIAQWDELAGQLAKVSPRFYTVVGNHDYQTAESKKIWQRYNGPDTYYSFVYKNVLFMALDTQDQQRDPDTGIGKAQYDWIRRTLREHLDVRWTFLFMHAPSYWLSDEWKALEADALRDRKYSVFAGDWHCYYHARRNGHDYYTLSVAGGASAMGSQKPLERSVLKGPEYGEMDHITWVTMTEEGPVVANILLDGVLPGDYLNQANSKSDCWLEPIDDPADPELVRQLAARNREKKAKFWGWNRKDFDRWTAVGGGAPGAAWRVADEELRFDCAAGASSLENVTDYQDVDFHFQVRLDEGGACKVTFEDENAVGDEGPIEYLVPSDLTDGRKWTFGRLVVTGTHVELEVDGVAVRKFERRNARPHGRIRLSALSGRGAFRGLYAFDLR